MDIACRNDGYEIFVKDEDSTAAVRIAQKPLESETKDRIDTSKSIVLFGKQLV